MLCLLHTEEPSVNSDISLESIAPVFCNLSSKYSQTDRPSAWSLRASSDTSQRSCVLETKMEPCSSSLGNLHACNQAWEVEDLPWILQEKEKRAREIPWVITEGILGCESKSCSMARLLLDFTIFFLSYLFSSFFFFLFFLFLIFLSSPIWFSSHGLISTMTKGCCHLPLSVANLKKLSCCVLQCFF